MTETDSEQLESELIEESSNIFDIKTLLNYGYIETAIKLGYKSNLPIEIFKDEFIEAGMHFLSDKSKLSLHRRITCLICAQEYDMIKNITDEIYDIFSVNSIKDAFGEEFENIVYSGVKPEDINFWEIGMREMRKYTLDDIQNKIININELHSKSSPLEVNLKYFISHLKSIEQEFNKYKKQEAVKGMDLYIRYNEFIQNCKLAYTYANQANDIYNKSEPLELINLRLEEIVSYYITEDKDFKTAIELYNIFNPEKARELKEKLNDRT